MFQVRKTLGVFFLCFIILTGGFFLWGSARFTVPILMYHHVDYTDTLRPDTVSPERFRWHMDYLRKHHFKVLGLDELVEMIRNRKAVPPKSVVITFDDGYENNYTHAYKILKEYHFPATIFISSDLVDMPGYLTIPQMHEMKQNQIDIGSHTRRHAYLPDLNQQQQRDEILGSKQRLGAILGAEVNYFAYPSGGFNDSVKRLVQSAGYKAACTTNRGFDPFNKDVYELNRVRFSDKDDRLDYLWIKLSGFYNVFRKSKNPY